jgi:hypothetical protein
MASEQKGAPAGGRNERLIERGSPTYGVDVGIMLLDATFPRPVGDIANGRTFSMPIHYEVTENASVPHVVERSAEGLLQNFLGTGRRLLKRGVKVLVTSCGFLAIFQKELADELRVPVATSSLLQIPLVLRLIASDQKVGVVTVNASTITPAHLDGAGISEADRERLVWIGLENSEHFYNVIVWDEGPLDVDRAEDELVKACTDAVAEHPEIGAFVFECTNMPPYSSAVRHATGRPVWDAITLVNWLQGGALGLSDRWAQ